MTARRLEAVRAAVFDAYGTLFDVNSAAARCSAVLGERAGELSRLWRDKQLQYTWLRSLMGRHADFWQLTADALDYALKTLGVDDAALRQELLQCYLTLDAFPDVLPALMRLKTAGIKTAILSNGSPPMLAAAVKGAKLEALIDAVLSVEEVGIYKPHPSVYRLASERLGVAPSEIAFASSNAWDAHGAASFGFKVAWCNRYAQRPERLPGQPDAEISSLGELPALLGL